jgi:hypothetical protein
MEAERGERDNVRANYDQHEEHDEEHENCGDQEAARRMTTLKSASGVSGSVMRDWKWGF